MYNQEQIKASNPAYSVWLLSSAGAGKTRVLTNRVLRLLLANVAPEKILCLTFTNAGATEMLTRIYNTINSWHKLSPGMLQAQLNQLLGRDANTSEVQSATNLFSNLFKTKFLKIYTIHAFCQKILKRFPVEAGVNPYFGIIDDIKISEVAQLLKASLITEALSGKEIDIDSFHEYTLLELIKEILSDSTKFSALIDKFISKDQYRLVLMKIHNIQYKSADELFARQLPQVQDISYPCEIAQQISLYTKYPLHQKIAEFNNIASLFLTAEGSPKKRIIDKQTSLKNPGLLEKLLEIQDVIVHISSQLKNIRVIDSSVNLFLIAKKIITGYSDYKNKYNYVDYNDLIAYASNLLSDSSYKDWVLYKLDSQIDHLLIDEAQDTSKSQWQIIQALIGDFFTGFSTKDANRTIFVVGDEKQSIYAFQGADLNHFIETRQLLKEKLEQSGQKLLDIEMLTSYRSGPAINNFVYDFLSALKEASLMSTMPAKLNIAKNNHPSRVELWPIIKCEEEHECFWPYYEKAVEMVDAEILMAKKLAEYIKNLLESKIILPSTNKAIKPSDIMIILRSRKNFIGKIIKQCHMMDIPISGRDRLLLNEVLSILDIICVAKFVCQPLDDLNLASLLKSPIIGITEEELQRMIFAKPHRKENLWTFLMSHEQTYQEILAKLHIFQALYNNSNIIEFFYILLEVMNYKTLLIKQNGMQDLDAIYEFLSLTENYYNNISTSLAEFIAWFNQNDIEIKRNLENTNDAVKILTIHGSKGLESPVIIMPDTVSTPSNIYNYIWFGEELPVWNIPNASIIEEFKVQKKQADNEEYWRLLYVALTRAQDYLIIGGYTNQKTNNTNSWYHLLEKTMEKIHTHKTDDGTMIYNYNDFAIDSKATDLSKTTELELKDLESFDINYLKMRNIDEFESPGQQYGTIAHKILEDIFKTKDITLANSHYALKNLENHDAKKLQKCLTNLFEQSFTQQWLSSDIKSEQEVIIKDGNNLYLARIDLLIIEKESIIIIDYKTDSIVPKDKSLVIDAYKNQLNLYAKAISEIYPLRQITTYILWLENNNLMELNSYK